MSSELVGTIFKFIAVAAPSVFVLLLVAVVVGNYFVAGMVRKRKDAEVELSRLAARVAAMKLTDLQSKEDCARLLVALDENERRVVALLSHDDLADEEEDELREGLAKIKANRAEILLFLQKIDLSQSEHAVLEDGLRQQEVKSKELREAMREMEENYAPVAILIDRFLEYVTNGLKVVVSEPKSAKRETVE